MGCHSIGDVLRSLERYRLEASHADIRDIAECPEPAATAPLAAQTDAAKLKVDFQFDETKATEASDPPVPYAQPWIDREKIAAANARDVVERVDDDRSRAQRREQQGWQSLLAAKRPSPNRFTFAAKLRAKGAPKPKRKRERTDETREYFALKMRELRARKKAEALVNSQAEPS